MEPGDIASPCKLCGLAMKQNGRRVAAFADHLDLAPADIAVPSSAHRLHGRLLGGKARGVTLITRTPTRFAISNFALREYPASKASAGHDPGQRPFYSIHFDNVDAGPDYRHAFSVRDRLRSSSEPALSFLSRLDQPATCGAMRDDSIVPT